MIDLQLGRFTGEFDDEELALWLAFDQMRKMGVQKASPLLEKFGSMKEAWDASDMAIESSLTKVSSFGSEGVFEFLSKRRELDPKKLLESMRKKGVDAYPIYHPLYPIGLRGIGDPPLMLYAKGKLHPDNWFYSIAVVGTRKPTVYGKKHGSSISRDLAQQGVTIVSGMAKGIDAHAHWGALEAKGRTVAVLANGPDIAYPYSNKDLYEELTTNPNCAVLSEYRPGTRPEKWQFPARNRIISGMTQGTLVVEGDITSGSLITAKLAFEQSRNVFAVPGSIESASSAGPNDLIVRNMAQLTRNYKDIMSALTWECSYKSEPELLPAVMQLFGREKEIFEMLSAEPTHFDHLCQKAGMGAGEMSGTLTMLELAGIVTRHPGDWYSRDPRSII